MKKEYLCDVIAFSISNIEECEKKNRLLDIEKKMTGMSDEDWNDIIENAKNHGVLGLISDTICDMMGVSDIIKKRTKEYTRSICLFNYRLFLLTKSIIEVFQENGIKSCALKGIAAASLYDVPEYRKSGDIDILISDDNKINQAVQLLEQKGFVRDEKQWTLHHVVLTGDNNVVVEIHTIISEPFDNKSINKSNELLMKDIDVHMQKDETIGIPFYRLDDAYHAYELLLHMTQHFLNKGFGLKLLCDWVRYWQKKYDGKTYQTYMNLVNENGLKKFSDIVTLTCVKHLGLKAELVDWMNIDNTYSSEIIDAFIGEVLESGEFGLEHSDRVIAVRGNGVGAYWRAFHHQMRRSFPRASKCFLTWPVLWIITFFRFVNNNKKVRSVSTMSVIKSAGNRGNLIEKMSLFERK